MIATHNTRGISTHPFDAGHRVAGVVNNVTKKQTRIKFFVDRRKRGPVGVNVSNQKNSHWRMIRVRVAMREVKALMVCKCRLPVLSPELPSIRNRIDQMYFAPGRPLLQCSDHLHH